MRAAIRPFAVALALFVLLPAAPASDAAEGWSAVGIQVREGRRPAPGVEVRLRPETASTAEPGAVVSGVTDGEGRAVLYLRPGIWRLELSSGEGVDYFVTVRVAPGRRAEELGSPARDVDAPDLRWRYFAVDEPPPLELLTPSRRPVAAPAPETAPADEAATPPVDQSPPPAAPPAEPDSVVPPPVVPPVAEAPPTGPAPEEGESPEASVPEAPPAADPATGEPPSLPTVPEEPAADEAADAPVAEPTDPTPSDSSPFDTVPRPPGPYDPPVAPTAPEPVEEPDEEPVEDVAPVSPEPVRTPAADAPGDEEEPMAPEQPPPPPATEPQSREEPAPAAPVPARPPVEVPAVEEPVTDPAPQAPTEDRPAEVAPTELEPSVEEPADAPPAALPTPAPALPPVVEPPAADPVEPELPPSPPRFSAGAVGECPDCRDDEAAVVVERTVAPGGGACDPQIAAAALDAARRLGGGVGDPRSLDGGPVARWTAGDGCQLLGVVLPAGGRYRGYRYEVEGGAAGGRCYAGSECPVAGAVWPDRPVIRTIDGGATLVYGLFRNTSEDRARRARLTVYYLP